eukprot:CAMPEP_0181446026 /NCGR_PEP_ID=MMETSP1110-20121109/25893_1 /TAXON_ID=174948 /ORGANISM="Symbiodinium sp., Strain CCMP421" /LENGTH=82 /DNA_ID=CAMNT_0023570093 /DNA_START=60 /DNA_END=305 /DNA_ORIENTATION=-
MAFRRPVLCVAALVACVWFLTPEAEPEVFVTPVALRGSTAQGNFVGLEAPAPESVLVLKALPEPRPNDAMLPVELNRTSLYW